MAAPPTPAPAGCSSAPYPYFWGLGAACKSDLVFQFWMLQSPILKKKSCLGNAPREIFEDRVVGGSDGLTDDESRV